MQSICCILGAGYSHVAGAPLTRDLFATRNVAIPAEAAGRRFQTVWKDYRRGYLKIPPATQRSTWQTCLSTDGRRCGPQTKDTC